METLGRQIATRRQQVGFQTQSALAKATGVPQPTISRIESGEMAPTRQTMARLAGALQCVFMTTRDGTALVTT